MESSNSFKTKPRRIPDLLHKFMFGNVCCKLCTMFRGKQLKDVKSPDPELFDLFTLEHTACTS